MDTACVELKFSDGSMIAIDTITLENEVADNMYQRSELDWLIYNTPLEYAQLVLYGGLEEYLKKISPRDMALDKVQRRQPSWLSPLPLLLVCYEILNFQGSQNVFML